MKRSASEPGLSILYSCMAEERPRGSYAIKNVCMYVCMYVSGFLSQNIGQSVIFNLKKKIIELD